MRWRGLLWDKDGTLLDTFSFWVELERRLAAALTGRFPEENPRSEYAERVLRGLGVDGSGRVDARGALAGGTERDILDVFYQTHRGPKPGRPDFERAARLELKGLLKTPPEPRLIPGIAAALEHARARGLAQGVATADTRLNAERDLRMAGLAGFFGFLASSDSARVKPHPWPVEAFAEWAGIAAAEVLVIGDTPVDQAMAEAAGADFAAVLWGTGRARDFGSSRLVKSAEDLPRLWAGT